MERVELGAYLRSRREKLKPADVGLITTGRRRTPGLRRDEVALLANMSTDYYERIEQARGPRPSATTLGAIARALRLTPDERDHIYLLAGQTPPRANIDSRYAEPGLMCILDALAPTVPALVCDNLYTILAQNPLNVALLGPLAVTEGRNGNFLWRWFTDPEWRSRYLAEGHEPLGRHYVADLRATVARRGQDAFARRFVSALCTRSAEFKRIWERRDVAVRKSVRKVILHPEVGRLDLECDAVVSPPSAQRLVLFRPQPGTGTAERLEMLGVVGTEIFARDPAATTADRPRESSVT
ncbi:helix-turn-helix transcriptional regulator [Actinomadura viridis]|uniref:helix-turn-helix transcriptional regulator n=1 Tax=Actinomadura viridis TaxID=58110 RepID=UPI0036A37F27